MCLYSMMFDQLSVQLGLGRDGIRHTPHRLPDQPPRKHRLQIIPSHLSGISDHDCPYSGLPSPHFLSLEYSSRHPGMSVTMRSARLVPSQSVMRPSLAGEFPVLWTQLGSRANT